METRKSDPRIYIITFLFLSCIISGGVLLGLDVFLPQENALFLTAGMVLVGVPWLFWFLAYLYRYIIKPCTAEISPRNAKILNIELETGNNKQKGNAKIPEKAALELPLTPRTSREGERHVQEENVMAIRKDEEAAEEESSVRGENLKSGDLVDRDEKGLDFSSDSDRKEMKLSAADASHRILGQIC